MAPHGVDRWYINSAPDHYRCHTIYITKTRAERIARTVDFFPHDIEMPHNSSGNNAAEAAKLLTDALMNPAPASPFPSLGNEQMWALRKLADIFSAAAPVKIPKLRDPAPSPRVLSRIQIRAPLKVLPTPQSPATQTTVKLLRLLTPQVRVLPRIQIRAPPRVQTTPQLARMQTTAQGPTGPMPLAPPPTLITNRSRPPPHPIKRYPTQDATPFAHSNQPHLIDPDDFDPQMHKYPLGSLS